MTSKPPARKADKQAEDITIDPSNLLSPEMRQKFAAACKKFKKVFGTDLPKYNGEFGKVEAVIHIPSALPPSTRLKEVPWYPKTMLAEMQVKFDELEEKGTVSENKWL